MKIYGVKFAIAISLVLSISACSKVEDSWEKNKKAGYESTPKRKDTWFKNPKDVIDPYGNLSRSDYQNLIVDRQGDINKSPVKPKLSMPNLDDMLADPDSQELENDKLVSISVNETVPLKDVLVELARKAEVDAEVDKNIKGSIIFIAKDRPFSEVIRRIADIANLRYSFEDGVLRIENDNPTVKSYKFNILDVTRSSTSNINTTFSVGGSSTGASGGGSSSSGGSSSGSGGTGGGVESGAIGGNSSSTLNSQSGDGEIWKAIEDGVKQIITNFGTRNYIDDTETDAASSNPQDSEAAGSIISVNKNAGMITVLATERQHRAVKEYLDSLIIELTSQVLIEARVVEVNLNDEFKSGINWNLLTDGVSTRNNVAIGGAFGATAASVTAPTDPGFKLSVLPTNLFGNDNTTLSTSVTLLQTFGTTRSLSNPRISTLNNQFAILNFSKNEIYFEIQQNTTTTTGTASTTDSSIQTNIRSVPIGVVLALQPSIDLQRNEIMMSVRPTLTRVTDRIDDPGAQIIAEQEGIDLENFQSQIPIVDTREIDTVLRIKNGEIMVIGGLLEERSENTDIGIPGLSAIPYIGNAFKSVQKTTANVETVIFIKATIVPGKGVAVEDKEFYKKFSKSRNKFFPN
jgi:general secretion pathway protein D